MVAALTAVAMAGIYIIASLTHEYLIWAEPDSARFTVNGSAVAGQGSFIFSEFMGQHTIECTFSSGAMVRARVYPRLGDDNSSSLLFREDGTIISYGDLRYERF